MAFPVDRGISWYLPHIHNLRLMKARYIRHAFRPHAHDYWVIGIVETGLQSFAYRNEHLVTSPGKLIIINPGEVHTGEAAASNGFVYRALYPPADLMEAVVNEFSLKSSYTPAFRGGLIDNPSLFQQIRQIHHNSSMPSQSLQVEQALTSFLVDLIRLHATANYGLKAFKKSPKAVSLARDYIEAHYAENISLKDLSAVAHISPYHLSRLFKRSMNMPPHKYLENVRIRHAERLLRADIAVADVAFATGFSSQSHLTRTFKRFLGMTPGDFTKMRKIV